MAADDYYHDTNNHTNYVEDGNLNYNDGRGDNDDAYDDEDDMPFAVDAEPSSVEDFLHGTAGGAMADETSSSILVSIVEKRSSIIFGDRQRARSINIVLAIARIQNLWSKIRSMMSCGV